MDQAKQYASRHPLIFVILALVGWLLTAGVLACLAGLVLNVSIMELLPQVVGSVRATALYILLVGLFGWVRAAGIARLGSWQVWVVASIITAYLAIAHQKGFFGEIWLDLSQFRYSSQAQMLLLGQLQVAFVEEILFRGILLYVLVRVWSAARSGLFRAALVTALLFGVLNILQAFAGSTPVEAGLTTVNCILSGSWWAALVLMWSSIWPAVLIHAFTNLAIMLPGMVYAPIGPIWWAYIRIILLELPIALYGIWLIRRMPLRTVLPDVP